MSQKSALVDGFTRYCLYAIKIKVKLERKAANESYKSRAYLDVFCLWTYGSPGSESDRLSVVCEHKRAVRSA